MHIISVLRGQKTPMVAKHGHDRLPTWGVGADRPRGFWRGVIRQLLARGALRTESGEFASLELVPDVARPILRGEQPVMLRDEPDRAEARRASRAPRAAASPPADGATTPASRRCGMARRGSAAAGVPPYVIFHDSVLREIAAVRPANLDGPRRASRRRRVEAGTLRRGGAAHRPRSA